MTNVRSPEELSVDELRRLLIEKRRKSRRERLERFRKTGRVVTLGSDLDSDALEHIHSNTDEEIEFKPRETKAPLRRRFLDSLLMIVEVLAVIGLVFLLFNGLEIMRQLNAQVAEVLVLPTLTPTPLIVAVVLPGGHSPPTSPGGAAPVEEGIPEHLRPIIQSLAAIPTPTPGPEQAIRIQIPAIRVDAPIVQGDGWEQLKKGVGQHVGSANPGQAGNLVLTAHNDVFGEVFRELDKLKNGDQVIIYTNQRSYTYIVTSSQVVEKTQVEFLDATSTPTVTLISCYPYLVDNKRIIIQGYLHRGND